MDTSLIFPVCTVALSAFAHRLRGGGWVSFGGTVIPRLIWGLVIGCQVWWVAHCIAQDTPLWLIPLCIACGYLTQIVAGNGSYQIMGRGQMGMNGRKRNHEWCAAFLPDWSYPWKPEADIFKTAVAWRWMYESAEEYQGALRVQTGRFYLPGFLVCLAGWFFVGAVRGAVAVLPVAFFAPDLLWAILGMALAQPIAYAVGYQIPFSFPSIRAYGPEWGEFLAGGLISISLGVLLL